MTKENLYPILEEEVEVEDLNPEADWTASGLEDFRVGVRNISLINRTNPAECVKKLIEFTERSAAGSHTIDFFRELHLYMFTLLETAWRVIPLVAFYIDSGKGRRSSKKKGRRKKKKNTPQPKTPEESHTGQ